MAPPKHPWFRFYCEALTDRKLRRLTPAQRWLWVAVLATARQSPDPGVLLIAEGIPATVGDLAEMAGVKPAEAREGVTRMVELGLIEGDPWSVTKWKQRQFESDTSTPRTRKHRAGNDERTPMERSGIGPEAEPETETELLLDPSATARATARGERQQRIDEACRTLANERATQRSDVGPGWAPATARGLATDHHQTLHAHLTAHPEATRQDLVDLIDTNPLARHAPPNPSSRIPPAQHILDALPERDNQLNAAQIAELRRQRTG